MLFRFIYCLLLLQVQPSASSPGRAETVQTTESVAGEKLFSFGGGGGVLIDEEKGGC